MSKILYVLDNGESYSSHCVYFVVADPDEWGSDIESLLLWRLTQGGRKVYEGDKVKVVLTSERFDIRAADECLTVPEFLSPDDFIDWMGNSYEERTRGVKPWPERCPGSEILGAKRALRLAAGWDALAANYTDQKCFLPEFKAGIGSGWFGE